MNANAATNIDQIINQMGRRRHVEYKKWAAPGLIWLQPPTKHEQANGRNMSQPDPPFNQEPAKKPNDPRRMIYAAAALALVVGGYSGYEVGQQNEVKTEVTSRIIYDTSGVW